MKDQVEAAAFLDTLDWDHVVPLVKDLTYAERAELDVEARHLVIGTGAVSVPHLDLEGGGGWVGNREMELIVPAWVEGVFAGAGAGAIASGAHADDDVGVGSADVHLSDVGGFDNPDVELLALLVGLHTFEVIWSPKDLRIFELK